jgi:hypothetical protein
MPDTHFERQRTTRRTMTIQHWLFGFIYSYSSEFEVSEVPLA